MEKLIYLAWGPAPDGDDRYRELFVDRVAPELVAAGARNVSVNVDDARSDVASPVPFPAGEEPHVAQISLWLDCHDRRSDVEAVVAGAGLRTAGYLVCESLYTDYGDNEWGRPRHWAPGEPSPSVLTVCLIHRPPGMDRGVWVARWHGVQSPVSARIQPRMRYVRNEVVRSLTDDAPPIDGIVEEAWPTADHITDPHRFFCSGGDAAVLDAHINEMLDSVTSFIDMARLRNATMTEYLLT